MPQRKVQLDPLDPGFLENPYPKFRELRNEEPVHYTDFGGGFWLVTRYQDVKRIARDNTMRNGPLDEDTELGGNLRGGPAERFYPLTMNHLDAPEHVRLRKLGEQALNRRTLVETIGPLLTELADQAVDAVTDRGQIDAVPDLAADVPLQIFCGLLDVPQEDRHMLYSWMPDFFRIFLPEANDEAGAQALHTVVQNVIDYFGPLIEERRLKPGNDMLSLYAQAESEGERFTDDEIMTMVAQTMAGGFDTSTSLISAAAHCFAQQPEQFELLRQAPAKLLAPAVEEILRWESPVQMMSRFATRELEIDGLTIPLGARMGTIVASANRDERVFDDPDRIMIDRLASKPIAFGGGRHFCIGVHLARLEGQALLSAMARKWRTIAPAGESKRAITTMVFRGFASVPITFEPAD
jgi:cytochrome P450